MIILLKKLNILIVLFAKVIQWMAFLVFLVFLLSPPLLSAQIYMNQSEFLTLVSQRSSSKPLSNPKFKSKAIWLKKEIQSHIKSILDHNYAKLRIRYKINPDHESPTTVWFLDEIGKERPISFGISVKNDQIQLIRVLEFRESRGYEIHIPAFSKQFEQAGLNHDGNLNQNIDGITGATMSVSAMKKIARLAIYLHKTVIAKLGTKNKK